MGVLSYTTHFLVSFDSLLNVSHRNSKTRQRAEKCETQQKMIFIQNLNLTVTVMLMFWFVFICILLFSVFCLLALVSTVFQVTYSYCELARLLLC